MRTTIQIPDGLFRDLIHLTGAKTKTAAILRAIRDYIRRQEMSRLKSLSGKIRVELDWRGAEKLELKSAARPR